MDSAENFGVDRVLFGEFSLERPAKQSQVFFEKIFSDIKDVNA